MTPTCQRLSLAFCLVALAGLIEGKTTQGEFQLSGGDDLEGPEAELTKFTFAAGGHGTIVGTFWLDATAVSTLLRYDIWLIRYGRGMFNLPLHHPVLGTAKLSSTTHLLFGRNLASFFDLAFAAKHPIPHSCNHVGHGCIVTVVVAFCLTVAISPSFDNTVQRALYCLFSIHQRRCLGSIHESAHLRREK